MRHQPTLSGHGFRFARSLACLCMSIGTLSAQAGFRVGDPLSPSGSGWSVEPRQGRLGMALPVAMVPGPIPIPVAFQVNGSFQTGTVTYYITLEDPVTTKPKRVMRRAFTRLPIYGALHFGYIGGKTGLTAYDYYERPQYVELNQPTYALEDGTLLRSSDFVSFNQLNSTFTLATDFNLAAQDASSVKADVLGTVATYTTTSAGLGSHAAAVADNLPVGFGALSTNYTVLMDKDRARIFVGLPALNVSVPVLWIDRFGHRVTFKWTRFTTGLPAGVTAINAVEVKNHLTKGVQVQWIECPAAASPSAESVQDLALVSFIGIQAPSVLVQGYPGVSTNFPSATGTPWQPGYTDVPPGIGGPVGRPTSLVMGPSGQVNAPSWSAYGLPRPTPPNDGTVPASNLSWRWEYDANHAELSAFTDMRNIRTAPTYVGGSVPSTTGLAIASRSVTQTVSTDSVEGIAHWRSWTWGTTAAGDPNVILKQAFGSVGTTPLTSCTRSVEINYVSSATSTLHFGNGAFNKVIVWDSSTGTPVAVSTTTSSLGAAGLSPSYSRPIQTDISRSGEPSRTEIATPDALGIQTLTTELRVNGTRIQVVTNTYDAQKEKLDPARLTKSSVVRYDLISGTALPESVSTNWTNWSNGFPLDVYQMGIRANSSASDGISYTFDATEGRVTGTKPYGVAKAPWTTSQTWQPNAWAVGSSTTQFQNPGDASGVYSGSLTQSVQTFDSAYRPKSITDARGLVTTTIYDTFGRVVSVKTDGQGLTSYTYAEDNRSRSVTQTIGTNQTVETKESLDGFGRVIRRNLPDGSAQTFTYDPLGRSASSRMINQTTLQEPWTTAYDALDRPVSITAPSGATQTISHAVSGNNARTTRSMTINDGTSNQSVVNQEFRNGFGQVVRTVAPDNSTTDYFYDGQGKLSYSTLLPSGAINAQVRQFQYDPLGRLIQKTEPETGITSYANFNALGKPTTVSQASGRTRTLTYDGLGRIRQVTSNAGGENLSYTFTGTDLTSSSTVSAGITVTQGFEYNNPGGRLSKETTIQPGFSSTIQYGIDSYGKLTDLTYPSGRFVQYAYDALGRTTGVKYNMGPGTPDVSVVSDILFNVWGQRKELKFNSGAFSRWSLKADNIHLDQWTVGNAGTAFPDGIRSYRFDTGDRMTKAGEWSLSHNPMSQVSQANFQPVNGADPAYSTFHGYDGFGNQTSHTVAGAIPASLNGFGLSPMTNNKVPGTATNNAMTGWVYNPNGEATSIGVNIGATQVISLGWDALGRVSGVSAPGATQYFAYNPSGMRVSLLDLVDASRSRKYAYTSGGLLLSEHSSTGAWKRDVIYLGSEAVAEIDVNGVHELHNDHLGTPRIVTKGSTGQIEGRQAYGPYGEAMVNTSPDNTYTPLTGYTGHIQTDATGLIYMRGRFYSPAWHRFVNSDQGLDPNSPNQFAYCGGSPTMATDPSGMWMVVEDNGRRRFVGGGRYGIGGGGGESAAQNVLVIAFWQVVGEICYGDSYGWEFYAYFNPTNSIRSMSQNGYTGYPDQDAAEKLASDLTSVLNQYNFNTAINKINLDPLAVADLVSVGLTSYDFGGTALAETLGATVSVTFASSAALSISLGVLDYKIFSGTIDTWQNNVDIARTLIFGLQDANSAYINTIRMNRNGWR